ncbi:alpha/beta hydrolase [Mesorhizobium sp. B2-3-13]|uniref:alpha/beta fold hydrolase n=1 Tax=Mesorhizobium sp. B2-3-13 TaxID=2589951 RepID=UPI0011297191|nr:alpha/beta hydrolase [Mesorhizobium sp. B2-3-13]TPL78946.1 alpha/beta hydrolase [Mesorhizobium sp. B2-3-13]
MNPVSFCDTPLLRIAYLDGGLQDGPPVVLLHGWPDDATTYARISPVLHEAGFRTFSPWLRGFGQTSFLSKETMRSGEIAAMAQDVLDFADALGLSRFAIVGHDWGARIAYLLASIFPDRISCCAALSLGWQPGKPATPAPEQAKAFWYQWFMATARGAEFVRKNRKEFARFQWDSWSPLGWFDDTIFDKVAVSFDNPDWPDVTLHSYRVRWGEAEPDPCYAELARRQTSVKIITVPTLTLHGGDDRVVLPPSSEGLEEHFTAPYKRVVLDAVGHFPTREASHEVSRLLASFLDSFGSR